MSPRASQNPPCMMAKGTVEMQKANRVSQWRWPSVELPKKPGLWESRLVWGSWKGGMSKRLKSQVPEKLWDQMTSTEQTCALYVCAKKNRALDKAISTGPICYIKEQLEQMGVAPAKFLTVPGK
eukprot:Skav203456  [mRNA]  locus=scaffold2237:110581:112862:- [translate_table: standard]